MLATFEYPFMRREIAHPVQLQAAELSETAVTFYNIEFPDSMTEIRRRNL
jgi:hypothetical protein